MATDETIYLISLEDGSPFGIGTADEIASLKAEGVLPQSATAVPHTVKAEVAFA